MIKNWKFLNAVILATFSVLFYAQVFAASFNNDFTQTNDNTIDWLPLTNDAVPNANPTLNFPGYPCLTAGTSANNTIASSNIPGCNYSTPDAAGLGSLRFTPAQQSKNSAILSEQTFPTNQGLEVTYTTYTYGGDSGGAAHGGADGMTFYMSDGALGTQVGGVNNLGGNGGALGYSCSNGNGVFDGIEGAYLGLGMDSYGNFLNNGDNTSTGIPVQLTASAANPNLSFNSFGSGNYQPNRIGMRGAGSVRWHWLNANYQALYPSTLTSSQRESAVKNTCRTGRLWSYAAAVVNNVSAMAVSGTTLTSTVAGHNFVNGDTISLGGTITATPVVQNITTLVNSGTNSTVVITVPSVTGYSNGQTVTLGGSITSAQGITSIGTYSATPTKTVRVRPASISGYSLGQNVIISGVTVPGLPVTLMVK